MADNQEQEHSSIFSMRQIAGQNKDPAALRPRGFCIAASQLFLFDIVIRAAFGIGREGDLENGIFATDIHGPILDPHAAGVRLLRHINGGAGHVRATMLALRFDDRDPEIGFQDGIAQAAIYRPDRGSTPAIRAGRRGGIQVVQSARGAVQRFEVSPQLRVVSLPIVGSVEV